MDRNFNMISEFNKKTTQKGFSMIELIVSMVVFLIAISAIFGVIRISTIMKKNTVNRTDQLRSARIAVEYLRRDALNAGFGYHRAGGNVPDNTPYELFGITKDADSERDLLTSIVAADNLTTNTVNTSNNMDFVAFVSRDASFNGGNLINYTSVGRDVDKVYVKTATNGAANCSANDLYLLESDTGTTQVVAMATNIVSKKQIELNFGDPLKINQKATGTGENISLLMSTSSGTIKKINIISYGITSNGTLVRKTYGNQSGTDQVEIRELVYGVQDFQVKYFMEDGTTLDNPSANHSGRDNQIKMNSVVQIQVAITIAPNYDGTSDAQGVPVTIREFISTRNLRYEAS